MRLTITADVLFDGSGREPIERPAVTLERGRIVLVEPRGARWRRPSHTVRDWAGCTIVPGLIDSHCHLALDPQLEVDDSVTFVTCSPAEEIVELMRSNARAAARSGVTTMRDCGSPGLTGVTMRRIASQARGEYPRLLVSGRPITTPAGHCNWMGLIAASPDQLRAAVTALAEEGVDFVKVMATGGMMTASSDPYAAQYTAEELAELVVEARRRAKRVAAHALSPAGVRVAVAARVDTLEHCVSTQSERQAFDPALGPAIAAAGIIVGVTAHGPLRALLRAGDTDAIRRRLAPHRDLRAAGVELTVHSDAGTPRSRFDGMAESIEIFQVGLGTTTTEALRAATTSAAAALGMDAEIGSVAAGRRGDLAVLDGDLRGDIRALRRVVATAHDGAFVTIS